MPRGKLNESYVKDVAVEYLKDYYCKLYNNNDIFAGKELCVKKSFKRPDGLIALKNGKNDIFVAVVEAKSCRTLGSLFPVDGDSRWFVHGVLFGTIISLIIGFVVPLMLWSRIILAAVGLVVGTFLYWLFTFRFTYYRYIGVVSQINNYPGNEKWIALSIDVYNKLSKEHKIDFEKKLRRSGIGLLIISSGSKVSTLIKPKAKAKKVIDMFVRCNEILQVIEK
ncbi:hypothetical protein LY28_03590 [Ruminiclostridium sufflavum DSM 19573]|uniref:Uncharacterized protein n=1 Tax=Ruminiclostridium sufflavum DSM 19573 TaxID=1121337 RepID=A0A318XFU9_9FIRM|nr:hypothetical protein [Ruminiclostridium sufflavum]PYG84797.1 hypothetical protein LY28_03590 [Ruminiclostridium sufflavum DSM 19573]